MAISGIGGVGAFSPIDFPALKTTAGSTDAQAAGEDFGSRISGALNNLQATTNKSDELATQLATGELTDAHDYMIAATQTELATQLTVAVRNKAVDAFNQIMNMQV